MSVKWHFVGVAHEALEKENKVIKKNTPMSCRREMTVDTIRVYKTPRSFGGESFSN